jgi:hypothetical protein
MKPIRTVLAAAALAAVVAQAPAHAAVSTTDANFNGSFDAVTYGAGGVASVTPFLFVQDFGSTQSPASQVLGTDIAYSYALGGNDTSLLSIAYRFVNNSPSFSFSNLRFMVNTQPDGNSSFVDTPGEVWGAKVGGDPDRRESVDFAAGLAADIVANNGLTNGPTTCVGTCDVDFALQWDLASLKPGEIWTITVGLSDNGQALSSRFLTAAGAPGPTLTFSGNAALVPEPSQVLWLAAGGLLLAMMRRRMGARG